MCNPMKRAIEEASIGVKHQHGGPFGAVIVKEDRIIAQAHNEVIGTNDPTAHAEVLAIRRAAALLKRFDLSDCTLYTTCEPCPMCYAAAHWAKIKHVVYGATREDAAAVGFDDRYLYEVLSGRITNERMHLHQADRQACMEVFKAYLQDKHRTAY